MINSNSAWAKAAVMLACASMTPSHLAAGPQPRLVTQDRIQMFGNKNASNTETIKVWVPKGKENYQVQVKGPQIWSIDYPDTFTARSDSDTFLTIRISPPQNTVAGSYPIEIILSELNTKGAVVNTQNFVYKHEVVSKPSLEISIPAEEALYISDSAFQKVEISVKNTGTSVLELSPKTTNTAKFATGYSWPLVLEVGETARIPVEVATYLYPSSQKGKIRFLLSLEDSFSKRTFSESIIYNTYEDGGVKENWFTLPSSIKFTNYFRERNMDRGLILSGKGPIAPKSDVLVDYELRWRDIYENKDSSLSGIGHVTLRDSKANIYASVGDINASTKGLIGKGERARSLLIGKDKGALQFQAYLQRSMDYSTNRTEVPKKTRSGAEVGYTFEDRSFVRLRGYGEENTNYTEHLKILDFEAQKTLAVGHTIFAGYAQQISGRSATSTDPQSSAGQAGRVIWAIARPQSSLSVRGEYGGPSFKGALSDVAKGTLNATYRSKKFNTGIQYYYIYNNLKRRTTGASNSLIDQSLIARMGYVFGKMLNVTGSVKLESSQTHALGTSPISDYKRGYARIDAVANPMKELRINARAEMEGHNYFNQNRKTVPLYNGMVSFNYRPIPILNLYATWDNKALVNSINDTEREDSYSYGFNIDNRKDSKLTVNWSNKFLTSAESHSMFIDYTCKVTRRFNAHFRLSSSYANNDPKVYDGQFSLERRFNAPLYKPSGQQAIAVHLRLPKDFKMQEPLLMQAGVRTLRVDKSGKYEAMIAGNKGQLFFINLPSDYITERAIPPLFATKGAARSIDVGIVKAASVGLHVEQSSDLASQLINPEKDMARLQKFINSMPIELENRLTGEKVQLKSKGENQFQSGNIRPGKWKLSLPDPIFPQIAFELKQNEISIAPGEKVEVALKLVSKERKLRVLSSAR